VTTPRGSIQETQKSVKEFVALKKKIVHRENNPIPPTELGLFRHEHYHDRMEVMCDCFQII
jgi:hypothetical protein